MAYKITAWFLAIMLAIASIVTAIGAVTKSNAPERALLLWPRNGFAVEEIAGRNAKAEIVKNDGSFPTEILSGQHHLAEEAFQSEPMTPEAVAVIALTKTAEKREKLMEKAFELSRREPFVMGWLVADSVSRNDVSSVLRYYDIMLRTNANSGPFIIPVMAEALAADGAVEAFVEILKPVPSWSASFWLETVKTANSIENAAELRKRLFTEGDQASHFRDADLIAALVSQQRFETAEDLFNLFTSRENRETIVRNGDFVDDSKYPPIDWKFFPNGEYGATISARSMQLSAVPNSGGLFARQILKLPKSLLTLSVLLDQNPPSGVRLNLELSCAEAIENRPERIKISLSEKSNVQKISNENSPCEYYWMDIVGRSSTRGEGFDITIDSISLLPG